MAGYRIEPVDELGEDRMTKLHPAGSERGCVVRRRAIEVLETAAKLVEGLLMEAEDAGLPNLVVSDAEHRTLENAAQDLRRRAARLGELARRGA